MVTIVSAIPNEDQLRRAYLGTEARLGVAVAPTFRLYGDLQLNKARPLADRTDYGGTYFTDYTVVRGPADITGTYAQPLSYEDLAILTRYAVEGGGTGVSDSETTPGYLYERIPEAELVGIDFASGEYFVPGLPFSFTGMFFPEFTISGDIDNTEACWMWNSQVMALTKTPKALTTGAATGGSTTTVVDSGASWTVNQFAGGYVRMKDGTAGNIGKVSRIASNTSTTLTLAEAMPSGVASGDDYEISGVFTSGISDRTRETIDFPGTKLYIDPQGAIGTTQILGRFISFSLTFSRTANGKRFAEDANGYSRYGFGGLRVTGQIRVEFDRMDQYQNWENGDELAIRIEQTGPTIDSGAGTTKEATIDLYRVVFDGHPTDTRNSNITATIPFRAYADETEGIPVSIFSKNELATLP
jgi:hypothetical protein